MSIDGPGAEYPVRANPGSFPDQRQLASVRKPGTKYLDGVRRFSILERDQEYMLAKRWRDHGDRDAADQLVTSHLRLAVACPSPQSSPNATWGCCRHWTALNPTEVFVSRLTRCGGSERRYRITSCDPGHL